MCNQDGLLLSALFQFLCHEHYKHLFCGLWPPLVSEPGSWGRQPVTACVPAIGHVSSEEGQVKTLITIHCCVLQADLETATLTQWKKHPLACMSEELQDMEMPVAAIEL